MGHEYSMSFRLYPNRSQQVLLAKTFGCVRLVYNRILAYREQVYQSEGRSPSYVECSKELTRIKHDEFPWLSEVDSIALQTSVRHLDDAYRNFFRKNHPAGKPRFKSKKTAKKSYTTKQHIQLTVTHVRLPKLGWVKCRVSKQVQGRILNATVTLRPSGKYFISITWTDVDIPRLPGTGSSVGLDMGLKDFAVMSDSRKVDNPRYLKKSLSRLKREQRRLSRKSRSGRNWEKQRQRVAKVYEKIVNQRRDFLQKLSTSVIRENDVIALEDLAVSNMAKNHRLARSISDVGWSEFNRMLGYKSDWYGRTLVHVDRFFPSSQICHDCGHREPAVRDLSVRSWTCPSCGSRHDRDVNAAMNILDEGLRMLSVG